MAWAFLVLVGCGNTYRHQPFNWRPPTPSAGGATDAPLVVQLDDFQGTDASQGPRVERVVALMQEVMNSAEFRCQVLSFDRQRPPWRLRRNPCVEDPDRRSRDGSQQGFAPSFSEAICPSDGSGLVSQTNAEVWANLLRAHERARLAPDGAALPDMQDHVVNLDLRLRVACFDGSYGATGDAFTETTRRRLPQWTDAELVGHWAHEYMHRLGYCDRGVEGEDRGLVSYVIGYLACVEAGYILNERGDVHDYRHRCVGMFRGAE